MSCNVKVEFGMFCNEVSPILMSHYFMNDVFVLYVFYSNLWYNFLAEIHHIALRCLECNNNNNNNNNNRTMTRSRRRRRRKRRTTNPSNRDSCRNLFKKMKNTTFLFSVFIFFIIIHSEQQTRTYHEYGDS